MFAFDPLQSVAILKSGHSTFELKGDDGKPLAPGLEGDRPERL